MFEPIHNYPETCINCHKDFCEHINGACPEEIEVAANYATGNRKDMDMIIATVINGKDITRGELLEAFNLVCDKDNWKNPIDVRIDNPGDHMLEVIKDAIMFFTGSTAYFRHVNGSVHITAKGYYFAIGA